MLSKLINRINISSRFSNKGKSIVRKGNYSLPFVSISEKMDFKHSPGMRILEHRVLTSRISQRYSRHPALATCNSALNPYLSKLNSINASSFVRNEERRGRKYRRFSMKNQKLASYKFKKIDGGSRRGCWKIKVYTATLPGSGNVVVSPRSLPLGHLPHVVEFLGPL